MLQDVNVIKNFSLEKKSGSNEVSKLNGETWANSRS